jgi:hypothetical protein
MSFAYALLVKQPRSQATGSFDNAEFVVYLWTASTIPVEIRQVVEPCVVIFKISTHMWRCSVLQYHLCEVNLRNLSEIVILNINLEKFFRKQNNRHISPISMIADDFSFEKTI